MGEAFGAEVGPLVGDVEVVRVGDLLVADLAPGDDIFVRRAARPVVVESTGPGSLPPPLPGRRSWKLRRFWPSHSTGWWAFLSEKYLWVTEPGTGRGTRPSAMCGRSSNCCSRRWSGGSGDDAGEWGGCPSIFTADTNSLTNVEVCCDAPRDVLSQEGGYLPKHEGKFPVRR